MIVNMRPINILLIEDNPGDVRLIQEVFKEGKIHNTLSIVKPSISVYPNSSVPFSINFFVIPILPFSKAKNKAVIFSSVTAFKFTPYDNNILA